MSSETLTLGDPNVDFIFSAPVFNCDDGRKLPMGKMMFIHESENNCIWLEDYEAIKLAENILSYFDVKHIKVISDE